MSRDQLCHWVPPSGMETLHFDESIVTTMVMQDARRLATGQKTLSIGKLDCFNGVFGDHDLSPSTRGLAAHTEIRS
jgi:hypothetical protein